MKSNPSSNWTEEMAQAHNRRVLLGKLVKSGAVLPPVTPAEIKSVKNQVDREGDLHEDIEDFCRAQGWLSIHSRMDRATTTAVGVSDFIILADGRTFCIECKAKGNKATVEQLAFLAHAKKMGATTGVVWSFPEFLEITRERMDEL